MVGEGRKAVGKSSHPCQRSWNVTRQLHTAAKRLVDNASLRAELRKDKTGNARIHGLKSEHYLQNQPNYSVNKHLINSYCV